MLYRKEGKAMLCPRCGQRDSVQSVRSIYEQGTSSGYTRGTGLGYGGDGHWGAGYFQGSTTQQTLLAQRLSPPDYSPILPVWMKLGLMFILYAPIALSVQTIYTSLWEYKDISSDDKILVFGNLFTAENMWYSLLGLVCVLLFLSLLVCLFMHAFPGVAVRQQRTKSLQNWDRSNYCHRCGCQF